jgi:hypothetical protein
VSLESNNVVTVVYNDERVNSSVTILDRFRVLVRHDAQSSRIGSDIKKRVIGHLSLER